MHNALLASLLVMAGLTIINGSADYGNRQMQPAASQGKAHCEQHIRLKLMIVQIQEQSSQRGCMPSIHCLNACIMMVSHLDYGTSNSCTLQNSAQCFVAHVSSKAQLFVAKASANIAHQLGLLQDKLRMQVSDDNQPAALAPSASSLQF